MASWPDDVDRAFRVVYYGGDAKQKIEAFAQRWNGLETEAFSRALENGTQEEKAVALFVLSDRNVPNIQEILLAALESIEPMEQWASTLCLGEKKDKQALPVLLSFFNEFLPPAIHPLEREGGLYHAWRIRTASLLGEWGRKDMVPAIRKAFGKAWKLEQADIIDRKHVWHEYQDELIYALGRLEAFGSLVGFTLPEARLRFWLVLLAAGSLQARNRYGDFLTQIQINETLQHEIAQVLEQRFGISPEHQMSYIDAYAQTYFDRRLWC
jgi:hypothetical protein